MRTLLPAFLGLVGLLGCSGAQGEPPAAPAPAALTGAAAVEVMKEAGEELVRQPEHDAARVEVQHLLVSFRGAVPKVTRSKEQAETLAAELYARVVAGEDFDGLVREHTDDNYPGIYTMTAGPPADSGEYLRSEMFAAFGDTGWRLEVGEVGIALHDPAQSPFGWQIVKRTR